MKVWDNGILRDMTEAEILEYNKELAETHNEQVTAEGEV